MDELPLWIGREDRAGSAVLRVVGDVDERAGTYLRGEVLDAVQRCRRVLVDLSRVGFIDSAGLSELVRADRAVVAWGGVMVLAGAHGWVRDMLAVTRLDTLLTISEDDTDDRGDAAAAGEAQPEPA